MFDLSNIPDYPERCDLFVKAESSFLDMKKCKRVGWPRLRLVYDAELGEIFFSRLQPEDDLQHTAHCMLLPILLDTHFREFLTCIDYYAVTKILAFHEVCEVVTGDIPANEADREKRRLKKLNDERLTEDYIRDAFPAEAQPELLQLNREFNNVDGKFTAGNHAGALDAFSFLFAVAHSIARFGVKDWLSPKEWMGICQNEYDRANYETAGTSYVLDSLYGGLLRGGLRDYELFPLMIALTEAHYRAIKREVPERLRKLYPYEIH